MAMYYLAILDNEYTESGEPGWIVKGPFFNAKMMMENLEDTLPQAVMARKVLFLRTVNLVEEDN
jgi:hydroxyacyl-ACP dehydratase HTD2-like protein with hotdog domain